MITYIIGSSCSGKSTYLKNTYIRCSKSIDVKKDLMAYTITDNAVIIGDCTIRGESIIERRRIGSDRIARTQIKYVPEQVKRIYETYGDDKEIVLEGVKVCGMPQFLEIVKLGIPIRLVYMKCSFNTSLKRNKELGSTVNAKTLQQTHTCMDNTFFRFLPYCMDAYVISTDDFDMDDFGNLDSSKLASNKYNRPKQLI